MNKVMSFTNKWLLALLLVTFAAGCGNSNNTPASDSKSITAYSLNGVSGTIDQSAQTIAVTMAAGTNLGALTATYTTTGDSVAVGATQQTSAVTANDFTADVDYMVTAADGSTANYTVSVSQNLASAKAFTEFSLGGSTGVIDEAAKTIAVTVPNGIDVSSLVATYTASGDFVEAGLSPQTYIVTAADGSTTIYTLVVTEAPASAKEITSFSINGNAGIINELTTPKTIAVTLRSGTDLTALIAKFTTTGKTISILGAPQVSTVTENDFSSAVDYLVTAGDLSAATYTLTVTEGSAQGPAPVNLGTAGDFAILAKAAVSATGITTVTGDIGVSPAAGTYITGFGLIADASNEFSTSALVVGKVYASNDAPPTPTKMTAAISDMELAYTDAAGRVNPDFTDLGAGDISDMTLVPGLYKYGTGLSISNVGVTFAGGANDVWIIQVASDLTVADSAIMTLSGGAQAKNIFWQIAGQATLGTTVDFKGIILSKTQISFNTGAEMNGRALAQTAVTLNATTITEPAL